MVYFGKQIKTSNMLQQRAEGVEEKRRRLGRLRRERSTQWQELFICDRESHEREGEARIFHVGLEGVADFRGNLVPRSGQQGDETVEPVGGGEAKGNSCDSGGGEARPDQGR